MTFFYNLNKKLDEIRATPAKTHSQLNERAAPTAANSQLAQALNERDMGKHNNATTGFDAVAKKAGGGEKGERIAGAQFQKMKKAGQLDELSPATLTNYAGKAAGQAAWSGGVAKAIDRRAADKEDRRYQDSTAVDPNVNYNQAADPYATLAKKRMAGAKQAIGKGATPNMQPYDYTKNGGYGDATNPAIKEAGLGDMAKKAGSMVKRVGGKVLDKLHGSDEDMIRDLQRKMGMPQTGIKPGSEPNPKLSKGRTPMDSKDKITFADKIAGAKKEVDEMLGDVAAEAIKGALSGKQKKLDKNHNGKLDANDFEMLRKGGKKQVADEGSTDNAFTAHKRPRAAAPTVGQVTHGAKHDTEEISGGRRVTRRTDAQGYSVGADGDQPADGEKRGRGRPKSATSAPERVTANATKHKGGRKATEDYGPMEEEDNSNELKAAMAMLKKAGYKVSKLDSESSSDDDSAPKKKSSGNKPDFADVDGDGDKKEPMKKAAKEKDSSEAKPKKVKEQGGAETPTASSGFSYGQGIYDSMNRELEKMIAESMSVNMSDSTEGGKSLTITATDEDAMKLAMILKSAGLGGSESMGQEMGQGEEPCSDCGMSDCGCSDVHEALDENEPDYPTDQTGTEDAMMYSGGVNGPKSTGQTTIPVIASQENRQATYEEDEAFRRMMEMAGVQQDNLKPWERTMKEEVEDDDEDDNAAERREEQAEQRRKDRRYDELDEAAKCSACDCDPCECDESVTESFEQMLSRMRDIAGIREAKKPDFLDMDKDGDKKEPMAKAVKDKEKKVEESIFALTNQWKAYKG